MKKITISLIAVAFISFGFVYILGILDKEKDVEKVGTTYVANQPAGTVVDWTFLNATTTTATSSSKMVKGAKRISFYFQRGGLVEANVGSTTFQVEISNNSTATKDDGSTLNWVVYNRLIDNVTNANSEQLTRVGSVTIEAATSTKIYSMDLETDIIGSVRVGVTEATDGEHTVKALISY